MARKRAQVALVLGAVLAAAAGVAVNRVGGSGRQQVVVFAVACAFLIGAGAVARWGGGRPGPQLRTADTEGRARQLGDVGLGELGVHWSRVTTDGYGPYVEREADRELDEAISGGQSLVVVAGAALAGCTRTLAEAAQRHLADSWLAWFEEMPGARLADLVAEARRQSWGGPVVLWLENADLALLSQFSAGLLDELPPGFRIFMTMDGDLLDSGVLRGEAAVVLNAPGACTRLQLITPAERTRLAAEPAYAMIAAAHKDEPVLMGRLMVSLDRITDALQTPDEDAVCRVAVLHAAVDWQRAAVPEPLTREVIERLHRDGYWQQLAGRRPRAAVSRSRFRQAIKQLLAPAPGRGLRLLDEVYSGHVTHLRPHPLLPVVADSPQRPPGWPISESLWNYLTKALNDSERLTVGLSACSRSDYRHARGLLDPLDAATIPAQVVFGIAVNADEAGETTAACAWYDKAIASGHADIAPRAMLNLGVLERKQGKIEEARGWYAKVIDSGHPDQAPKAIFNLGALEREQGRFKEARDWFGKVTTSGHADMAPMAMLNLGTLDQQEGRIKGARIWFTRAIDSGHPNAAPQAMVDIGLLEEGQRHLKEARSWYTKAMASKHPYAAPLAMLDLGVLENRQGRIGQARKWWDEAIKSGNAACVPQLRLSS